MSTVGSPGKADGCTRGQHLIPGARATALQKRFLRSAQAVRDLLRNAGYIDVSGAANGAGIPRVAFAHTIADTQHPDSEPEHS